MDAVTERIVVGVVLVALVAGVVVLGVTNDNSATLVFGLLGLILTTGVGYLRTGKIAESVGELMSELGTVKHQTNGALSELVAKVDPAGETRAASIVKEHNDNQEGGNP